jgi:hypothetical protein
MGISDFRSPTKANAVVRTPRTTKPWGSRLSSHRGTGVASSLTGGVSLIGHIRTEVLSKRLVRPQTPDRPRVSRGRTPDQADGRARVIRLTPRGKRLAKTIYDEARKAEVRIAEVLGPRRFDQLQSSLDLLAELT